MKTLSKTILNTVLKKADIYLVVTGIFSYLLGCAVADFLGNSLAIDLCLLGLFLLFSIYVSFLIVGYYFEEAQIGSNTQTEQKSKLQLNLTLALIAFALLVNAFLIFLIQQKRQLTLESWLFLAAFFVFSFILKMPKLKRVLNPFSLFIKAFLVSGLIPAISLLLQGFELNRLIPLLAFPLFFLHSACSLARSFSNYANDLSKNRRSTLVTLGWEKGIFFHNVMVLFAFLLLGLGPLFGLAWKITWPALTLGIVGLFQIFQLQKIAQGAKPNWLLLNWTALILYAITVYMLLFAFFIY